MYTLLVCCDLYGEKINLEITFPAMPTIGELQRKVSDVFNSEAAVKRPQGYPNVEFSVARLQIYDDVLLKWADLVTCTQLHEYDQLYAFQPQSPWHIDVQKDLPPPRPPTVQQSVHSTAAPPAHQPEFHNTSAASPVPYNQQQQSFGSPAPTNFQSPYAAAPAPTPNTAYRGGQQQRSPTQDRLEQQRQREEQLRQELARVHEETMRMEQVAQHEVEEERRRAADEKERLYRQKEADIARQREALRQMEEELARAKGDENNAARTLYR